MNAPKIIKSRRSGLTLSRPRRAIWPATRSGGRRIFSPGSACGDAVAVRARLEAKRDRIEGERQRNIDLVIKYVISEEDAKRRIAELKEERSRVEAELAALEETPVPIALHPAALDRYINTVNALA